MQLQHLTHLYHAKAQEAKTLVGKLEGNLDLVSDLPEHMGSIFSHLCSIWVENCVYGKRTNIY